MRRLSLLIFGSTFAVLFLALAVAEGIGDPSVPDDAMAVIEDTPNGTVKITRAEFEREFKRIALANGLEPPLPGEYQYDGFKKQAIDTLLQKVWVTGQAEELGVALTDEELAAEVEKAKDKQFSSEAEFKSALKSSHSTEAEFAQSVEQQVVTDKIQKLVEENAPTPTQSEVEDFYDAYVDYEEATAEPRPETRSIGLILNRDRGKIERAKALLEKDNSWDGWEKVAEKHSEAPAQVEDGRVSVEERELEEPLDAAVFEAEPSRLIGPVETPKGFAVFEVQSYSEASDGLSHRSLEEMEEEITDRLKSQLMQEYIADFGSDYNIKWRSRTFCAPGFVVEQCANFELPSHPSDAPTGCYEADPKGGRPDACPAPVPQTRPALPGSVSPLESKGQQLPQLPHPVEAEGESATEAPEGSAPLPVE